MIIKNKCRQMRIKIKNEQMRVKDKCGQMKIQQMAFMLLAVSLLFAMVAMFFIILKVTSLEKDYQEMQKEKADILVTKIASFPELSFRGEARAVDMDKLILLKDKEEYIGFWGNGVKGIIVMKVYPPGELVECEKGNYQNCSLIKIFTTRAISDVSSYVSLCRNVNGDFGDDYECDVALLMLDIYEENKKGSS
jgi:hypothetical protein